MFGQQNRRAIAGYTQIAGYQQIAGADAYATTNLRRTLRGAGAALPMGADGPVAVNDPGGRMRFLPMGFFFAAVGKSTQQAVSDRPQSTFRPERLVLPATVDAAANPFIVNDIKVGNRSQFVNSTGIPAATFFGDSVGITLACDTASNGMDIILLVTNTDAAATHDFRAALLGQAALPG